MSTYTERAAALANLLRPLQTEHPLIRIGAFGDGGYLVPDDMRGIVCCVSPGVSRQSSFELDMAKRGIPSIMADASVEGPGEEVPGARFRKAFVGARTEGETITLEDWIAQDAPAEGDILLQMDIEGAEYQTLSVLPDAVWDRIRILVIELHRLPSILLKPAVYDRTHPVMEAIAARFGCVHLNPNNASGAKEIEGETIPRVVEATFLRRDRATWGPPVTGLPHSLDRPHREDRREMTLPRSWIG